MIQHLYIKKKIESYRSIKRQPLFYYLVKVAGLGVSVLMTFLADHSIDTDPSPHKLYMGTALSHMLFRDTGRFVSLMRFRKYIVCGG